MLKPLNLLAFLLGLSLAFVPLSYALDCSDGSCLYGPNQYGQHYCVHYSCPTPATSVTHDILIVMGGSSTLYTGSEVCQWDTNGAYEVGCDTYGMPPPEPVVCSDGERSEGETGIDCGGICSPECVTACPAGLELRVGSDGFKTCVDLGYVNDFGSCAECPAGTYLHKIGSECQCVTFAAPVTGSQDYLDSNPPTSIDSPIDFSSGTFSVVQTPETVVDNGDGTETATIQTVKTAPDGSTSTGSTSVSRPSGSASGTGFSSSGTGSVGVEAGYDGSEDGEIEPEAVAGSTSEPDFLDFGGVLGEQLTIAQGEIETFIDDFENTGIVQMMNTVLTPPADTITDDSLSLDCGSYGVHSFEIGTDSLMEIVGGVLRVGAFITGVYIVFRKV